RFAAGVRISPKTALRKGRIMRFGRGLSAIAIVSLALVLVLSAQAVRRVGPGVHISVLSAFPGGGGPASAAGSNTGGVVVPAARKIVRVGPNGQQKAFPVTLPGGAFGIGPIGIAYDLHHGLYVALPAAFGPPAGGTPGILKISENGKDATAVPGSE